MCTVNMTFEVPESKNIDIEALKRQMRSYFDYILSMPPATAKTVDEAHIFDCFDGGGWASDPRSAQQIADELHDSRVSNRPMMEPW